MICPVCGVDSNKIEIRQLENGDYVKMWNCLRCGRLLKTEMWRAEYL